MLLDVTELLTREPVREGSRTEHPTARPRRGWRYAATIVALSLASGAAGGGAVFAALSLSGTITRSQPAPVQIATMPLPNVPQMLAGLGPSVVAIDVVGVALGADGAPTVSRGAGTGFVLDSSGLIATNAHVVVGTRAVQVTLSDGSVLPATLVGMDRAEDLAVIKVQRSDLHPVRLGSSSALKVGELVVAVGNALALKGGPTASLGIVSAVDRTITVEGNTYTHLIQTDAAINSGDSGGPLVEADGRVVGINTAAASSAESIGFAIAIDDAAPILRQLAGS